jgi:hypothetical protein
MLLRGNQVRPAPYSARGLTETGPELAATTTTTIFFLRAYTRAGAYYQTTAP